MLTLANEHYLYITDDSPDVLRVVNVFQPHIVPYDRRTPIAPHRQHKGYL